MICATISAAVRLRTRRWVPVWQNTMQAEGAADLRGEAQGAAILLGDVDGLDLLPVSKAQQPFAGSVDRGQRRGRPPAAAQCVMRRRALRGTASTTRSSPRNRWRPDDRSSARAGARGTVPALANAASSRGECGAAGNPTRLGRGASDRVGVAMARLYSGGQARPPRSTRRRDHFVATLLAMTPSLASLRAQRSNLDGSPG